MNTPKISVIVPVYNVEQYLPRCIDSILAQTFTDFELLLIDDGSPDNSGKICDEYAEKDLRIRVFHKINGGVSSARNMGLDNAQGEWIAFVDADDWIANNYLESFESKINNTTTVLYIQQCNAISQFNQKLWPATFSDKVYDMHNMIIDEMFNDVLIYGTPWGKLFNIKIIRDNSLVFDENLSLREDHCFFLEYIYCCSAINVNSNVGYYYNLANVNSLTKKTNLPTVEKILYSYEKLRKIEMLIINKFKYSLNEIKKFDSFLYYIKISMIKSAYCKSYSHSEKIDVLRLFKNSETIKMFKPNTVRGRCFKLILLLRPFWLQNVILGFFKNKM